MDKLGAHGFHGKRRRDADQPHGPGSQPGPAPAAAAAAARLGPAGSSPSVHDVRPTGHARPVPPLRDREVAAAAPAGAGDGAQPEHGAAVSVTVNGDVQYERALLAADPGKLLTRPPGDRSTGLVAHETNDDLMLVLRGPAAGPGPVPERMIGLLRLEPQDRRLLAIAKEAVHAFRQAVGHQPIEVSVGAASEWMETYLTTALDGPESIDELLAAYRIDARPARHMSVQDRCDWAQAQIIARHTRLAQDLAHLFSGDRFEMPHEGVFVDPSGEVDTFDDEQHIARALPLPVPWPSRRSFAHGDGGAAPAVRPTEAAHARFTERGFQLPGKREAADPLPRTQRARHDERQADAMLADAGFKAFARDSKRPARPAAPDPRADVRASDPVLPSRTLQTAQGPLLARLADVAHRAAHEVDAPLMILRSSDRGDALVARSLPLGAAICFTAAGKALALVHTGELSRLRTEVPKQAIRFIQATGLPQFDCELSYDLAPQEQAMRARFTEVATSSSSDPWPPFFAYCRSTWPCAPRTPQAALALLPADARTADKLDAVVTALLDNQAEFIRQQAAELGIEASRTENAGVILSWPGDVRAVRPSDGADR